MRKVYFTVAMVCYAAALMTCAVVMLVFKAAQPALLYLVPYCLGGVIIAAAVRGELDKL
jgi:minor histocompatibility antigen H13